MNLKVVSNFAFKYFETVEYCRDRQEEARECCCDCI